MNMLALVQRSIKKKHSEKNGITTVRVQPDMYFNFSCVKSAEELATPKSIHDFERALSKAFQAFDKVMEEEMTD